MGTAGSVYPSAILFPLSGGSDINLILECIFDSIISASRGVRRRRDISLRKDPVSHSKYPNSQLLRVALSKELVLCFWFAEGGMRLQQRSVDCLNKYATRRLRASPTCSKQCLWEWVFCILQSIPPGRWGNVELGGRNPPSRMKCNLSCCHWQFLGTLLKYLTPTMSR